MFYPVTLTKDDNGTILVTFPDVPEAVTCGDTPDDALAQARDALLTIFDAFMKDRRDIPPPSPAAGTGVMLPALESTKIALYRAMRAGKVNKSQLAKRLDWHLPQVDRVLNVRHGSQLDQIEAALAAVGKRLVVHTADLEHVTLTVRSRGASNWHGTRRHLAGPAQQGRPARMAGGEGLAGHDSGGLSAVDRGDKAFSSGDGRRFGFSVGTAFLLLTGVMLWRGHSRVAYGTATIGLLLMLGSLTVPSRLGPVYRACFGGP